MASKAELQTRLRAAYRSYALGAGLPADRAIKLPSALGVEDDGHGLLLRLDSRAVKSNVQTDAAAFEAWALVLRLWLNVPRITLDWEALPKGHGNGHYERFLYRVIQFRSLFPEWFFVANETKLAICRAMTERTPLLNVASVKTSSGSASSAKAVHPEHILEMDLISSESFRRHFGLKTGLVDRQFPVGMFAGKVSNATRIFTGGKSAIDIVALGEDGRFFIFELKAGDNAPVGTLSEMLLYTGLLREAAQEDPRIGFKNAQPSPRACVHPVHLWQCTGIEAVMLVERFHPLLEHPELLNTFNRAAVAHWNAIPGSKPVHFSKALVSDFRRSPSGGARSTPESAA